MLPDFTSKIIVKYGLKYYVKSSLKADPKHRLGSQSGSARKVIFLMSFVTLAALVENFLRKFPWILFVIKFHFCKFRKTLF